MSEITIFFFSESQN